MEKKAKSPDGDDHVRDAAKDMRHKCNGQIHMSSARLH